MLCDRVSAEYDTTIALMMILEIPDRLPTNYVWRPPLSSTGALVLS